MSNHITLLSNVRCMDRATGSLYYYQGNFFQPLTSNGSEVGRIKKAIKIFKQENRELIAKDQAAPGYKTLLELFDEIGDST
jgi:hypothetical protein